MTNTEKQIEYQRQYIEPFLSTTPCWTPWSWCWREHPYVRSHSSISSLSSSGWTDPRCAKSLSKSRRRGVGVVKEDTKLWTLQSGWSMDLRNQNFIHGKMEHASPWPNALKRIQTTLVWKQIIIWLAVSQNPSARYRQVRGHLTTVPSCRP